MLMACATDRLADGDQDLLISLSVLAIRVGLKPTTCSLGNHRSIPLSYRTKEIGALGWIRTNLIPFRRRMPSPVEPRAHLWRPEPESNRPTSFCRALRHHSAIWPCWQPLPASIRAPPLSESGALPNELRGNGNGQASGT